jgi:phosphoribosylformylglycinamidine cyclo-ligase
MLQAAGHIAPDEMARTFNCGIGMTVIVGADEAESVTAALEGAAETVFRIGKVEEGKRGCTVHGIGWSAIHHA